MLFAIMSTVSFSSHHVLPCLRNKHREEGDAGQTVERQGTVGNPSAKIQYSTVLTTVLHHHRYYDAQASSGSLLLSSPATSIVTHISQVS